MAQVDALVGSVASEFGAIDILVNAVGGSTVIDKPTASTEHLTLADWQKLIAFNLDGTFLFTHAVVPVMKAQRSGKIEIILCAARGRPHFEDDGNHRFLRSRQGPGSDRGLLSAVALRDHVGGRVEALHGAPARC